MDLILIIFVVSIILVALYFKNFKSVVYFLGIIEIFCRLTHKISSLLKIGIITKYVNKYIPNSLETIIDTYSSGILNIVLVWILILLFVFFEWYLIKNWLNKKK